jgi:hypothetical protein
MLKKIKMTVRFVILTSQHSLEFDLGINSAINCRSLVYKELLLSLKSPKVRILYHLLHA